MAGLQDLLSSIPMDQLASRLGVDEQTAESATKEALPALLAGMQANAQDPNGAASLQSALSGHDATLVEGGVNLDQVNTDDGAKIVRNVFGDQQGAVVNQLGSIGGDGGGSLIGKLLPMLAPIAMSYLAGKVGGGQQGATDEPTEQGGTAGGISDLLGGLLGGGGGGLGGLGGLLGGGSGQANSGGLDIGGLLGGLLGGGKK